MSNRIIIKRNYECQTTNKLLVRSEIRPYVSPILNGQQVYGSKAKRDGNSPGASVMPWEFLEESKPLV